MTLDNLCEGIVAGKLPLFAAGNKTGKSIFNIDTSTMGTKLFAESYGIKLMGDERDVMVSAKLQGQVLDWCKENGIEVEISGVADKDNSHFHMIQRYFKVNLWRVRNDAHRTLFILRWA